MDVDFRPENKRKVPEKMEYKTLYFPLFYESVENAEPLSDESFGKIIRIACKRIQGERISEELAPELLAFCNTIVSSAERVFLGSGAQNNQKSWSNKKSERELSREELERADKGFQKALLRTYGENA